MELEKETEEIESLIRQENNDFKLIESENKIYKKKNYNEMENENKSLKNGIRFISNNIDILKKKIEILVNLK